MTTNSVRKDPTTKQNFLDRMMSRDFSGDLADLAVNRDLRYERVKPNVISLRFGDSGQTFEMVIRKPRSPEALAAMRAKAAGKTVGKKPSRRQTTTEAREGTEVAAAPEIRQPRRGAAGNSPRTRGRAAAGQDNGATQ